MYRSERQIGSDAEQRHAGRGLLKVPFWDLVGATEESKENTNYNSPPRAGIHTGYHQNELQTDYKCVPYEACPDISVMELTQFRFKQCRALSPSY
jgi:hypothetical protein